jgi:hypothetical protein
MIGHSALISLLGSFDPFDLRGIATTILVHVITVALRLARSGRNERRLLYPTPCHHAKPVLR